jgi:hypothetical protein
MADHRWQQCWGAAIAVELRWLLRARCREYIWHRNAPDASGRVTYRYEICHRLRFHRGAHKA